MNRMDVELLPEGVEYHKMEAEMIAKEHGGNTLTCAKEGCGFEGALDEYNVQQNVGGYPKDVAQCPRCSHVMCRHCGLQWEGVHESLNCGEARKLFESPHRYVKCGKKDCGCSGELIENETAKHFGTFPFLFFLCTVYWGLLFA